MDIETLRVKILASHFVRLGWLDKTVTDSTTGPSKNVRHGSASCFVVLIRGEWFLITAGHVIKKLDFALGKGSRLEGFYLDDNMGLAAQHHMGIPFAYKEAPRYSTARDPDDLVGDEGLDYGFIHLRPNHRELLRANGIDALSADAWKNPDPKSYLYYAMIGVPDEKVASGTKPGKVGKELVYMELEPVKPGAAPAKLRQKFERLYYRLPEESKGNLTSALGLSGGPVFGFRDQGEDEDYQVIGVQSGWDPDTRVIAVCPIAAFLKIMEDAIDEMRRIADDAP